MPADRSGQAASCDATRPFIGEPSRIDVRFDVHVPPGVTSLRSRSRAKTIPPYASGFAQFVTMVVEMQF
jgi:hypothetical protein